MKFQIAVFMSGALACAASLAMPQDKPDAAKKQAWQPPKPGPEHDVLRQFEGQWDAEVRHCAQHGDSEVAKGTETGSLKLGGFWLISEFKGDMMKQPFQGHGMLGYDQMKKRYVMTWNSSASSNLTVFEGDYDAKSRTLTMTADCVGPDGKAGKLRITHAVKDPDHTVFELIGVGMDKDGKDCPCMTIHYTRRR